jgi:chemotaxis protein CheX
MNLQAMLIESLSQATAQVFSTMLGVEIARGEVAAEDGTQEANDGVVSFIGLAGEWAGTGSVSCSPVLACRICSAMLMCEATAVNEEVLDAVAELTNMIIGSVKNDMEAHLGPLGLSIPTVVFGRNFKTKSAGSNEWTVVKFHWEDEILQVRICLTPSGRSSHVMLHTGGTQSCALDV